MTQDQVIELSKKLAELYAVDAVRWEPTIGGRSRQVYIAEDSGRISDLADDNGVDVLFYEQYVVGRHGNIRTFNQHFCNHPTKHDAARMARVRCLIAIGEK